MSSNALNDIIGVLPASVTNQIKSCISNRSSSTISPEIVESSKVKSDSAEKSIRKWPHVPAEERSMVQDVLMTQYPSHEQIHMTPAEIFVLKNESSPGFFHRDHFLGDELALRVLEDVKDFISSSNSLRAAGMGKKGGSYRIDEEKRGDLIMWLNRDSKSNPLPDSIEYLLQRIEYIVHAFAKACPEFNLVNQSSSQFALFPGNGTRFVRHTDAAFYPADQNEVLPEKQRRRKITCLFYLNRFWEPSHGGQLRIHNPTVGGGSSSFDLSPLLDRLVVFRSENVEHEVLPSFENRLAITIWYYGKINSDNATLGNPMTSNPIAPQLVVDERNFCAPPPLNYEKNVITEESTIFVSIPSYCDSECVHTIRNLFEMAKNPGRVYVGVCLQYNPMTQQDAFDLHELHDYRHKSQIRVLHVHFLDAKGPVNARFQIEKLYNGEKFYLQIDSHMRFRQNWEAFLIHQLEVCPSSKPILTGYPSGYELPHQIDQDTRPVLLCASGFDDDGFFRQKGRRLKEIPSSPIVSLYWAAGFSFSRATVLAEVPYDGKLPFLFFGEEACMASRLYTAGYDFFLPTECVVYHLYKRDHRPSFQQLARPRQKQLKMLSQKRALSLLQNEIVGTHGLGSARSLKEYIQYCGVDFTNKSIQDFAYCGGQDSSFFE